MNDMMETKLPRQCALLPMDFGSALQHGQHGSRVI
jgi:hypothetical protein